MLLHFDGRSLNMKKKNVDVNAETVVEFIDFYLFLRKDDMKE